MMQKEVYNFKFVILEHKAIWLLVQPSKRMRARTYIYIYRMSYDVLMLTGFKRPSGVRSRSESGEYIFMR